MFLNTNFLQSDEIKLTLEKTSPGDPERGYLPAYHFAVESKQGVKMGSCSLRVGHSERVYYGGNIGYGIDEQYRGHHYAGKACLMLLELARRHDMGYVIISCNPENTASRKTIEYAGGKLVETAKLPEDSDMYKRGEREVFIYRFEL